MSDENVNEKPQRFAVDKAVGLIALVVVAYGLGYWTANRQQAPVPPSAAPAANAQPPAAPQISPADAVILAETKIKQQPTPDNYVILSLAYYRSARYSDAVTAAKEAVKLNPNYPEAWNNVAAGYQGLEQWDDAIAAAQQALKLKPDFQIAKNNLAFAQAQKLRQITSKK